jgi:chromatin remodeling complex protein RSC6
VDEVVASTDSTLGSQFNEFLAKLQLVATSISSLKNEFRVLEKRCNREFKIAQKESAKNKRRQGNRKPTGFIKPALISNELASFLGKPEGTEMARTDVTKEINSYIIAHDLQDPKCRRTILADGPLRTLLKLGDGDELTYFNLQTYMRSHFPKPALPAVTAAV